MLDAPCDSRPGFPQAPLRTVPAYLLALLVVRGLPAALYAPALGRRHALAAGLLQATSLPFIVAATQIGVALGELSPVDAAALVTAGLLSVLAFPPAALTLLKERVPDNRRTREPAPVV